jgi:hypothetical protein
VDSTQQTEDLGADAVEATRLGLLNLNRIAGFLVSATCAPGKDYQLLENMYGQVLSQWSREMGHVVNVVGGVEDINLYYGDAPQRYHPQPASYQRAAVSFLLTNALRTPVMFTSTNLVLRLTAEGVAMRVLGAQRAVLAGLVNPRRLNRMAEIQSQSGESAYAPAELFQSLREGLFEEYRPETAKPEVDVYRRNLQRAYVSQLAAALKDPAVNSDLPAWARSELEQIRARLLSKLDPKNQTGETAVHTQDLLTRIRDALDPVPARSN